MRLLLELVPRLLEGAGCGQVEAIKQRREAGAVGAEGIVAEERLEHGEEALHDALLPLAVAEPLADHRKARRERDGSKLHTTAQPATAVDARLGEAVAHEP